MTRTPEEAEIVRKASEKAQAGIAALRAQRLAEGHTEADLTMIHALAEQALIEKLARCSMGPANEKGRQGFIFHGEPGPAEQHWAKLVERPKRVVKGGPLIGQEF